MGRLTHVAKQTEIFSLECRGKADRIIVIKSNLSRNSGICATSNK